MNRRSDVAEEIALKRKLVTGSLLDPSPSSVANDDASKTSRNVMTTTTTKTTRGSLAVVPQPPSTSKADSSPSPSPSPFLTETSLTTNGSPKVTSFSPPQPSATKAEQTAEEDQRQRRQKTQTGGKFGGTTIKPVLPMNTKATTGTTTTTARKSVLRGRQQETVSKHDNDASPHKEDEGVIVANVDLSSVVGPIVTTNGPKSATSIKKSVVRTELGAVLLAAKQKAFAEEEADSMKQSNAYVESQIAEEREQHIQDLYEKQAEADRVRNNHTVEAEKLIQRLRNAFEVCGTLDVPTYNKMQESSIDDFIEQSRARRQAFSAQRRAETFLSTLEIEGAFERDVSANTSLLPQDESLGDDRDILLLGIELGLLTPQGEYKNKFCGCESKFDQMKEKIEDTVTARCKAMYLGAFVKRLDTMVEFVQNFSKNSAEQEVKLKEELNASRKKASQLAEEVSALAETVANLQKTVKSSGILTNSKGEGLGLAPHAMQRHLLLTKTYASFEQTQLALHDHDGYLDPFKMKQEEREKRNAKAALGRRVNAGVQTLTARQIFEEHGIVVGSGGHNNDSSNAKNSSGTEENRHLAAKIKKIEVPDPTKALEDALRTARMSLWAGESDILAPQSNRSNSPKKSLATTASATGNNASFKKRAPTPAQATPTNSMGKHVSNLNRSIGTPTSGPQDPAPLRSKPGTPAPDQRASSSSANPPFDTASSSFSLSLPFPQNHQMQLGKIVRRIFNAAVGALSGLESNRVDALSYLALAVPADCVREEEIETKIETSNSDSKRLVENTIKQLKEFAQELASLSTAGFFDSVGRGGDRDGGDKIGPAPVRSSSTPNANNQLRVTFTQNTDEEGHPEYPTEATTVENITSTSTTRRQREKSTNDNNKSNSSVKKEGGMAGVKTSPSERALSIASDLGTKDDNGERDPYEDRRDSEFFETDDDDDDEQDTSSVFSSGSAPRINAKGKAKGVKKGTAAGTSSSRLNDNSKPYSRGNRNSQQPAPVTIRRSTKNENTGGDDHQGASSSQMGKRKSSQFSKKASSRTNSRVSSADIHGSSAKLSVEKLQQHLDVAEMRLENHKKAVASYEKAIITIAETLNEVFAPTGERFDALCGEFLTHKLFSTRQSARNSNSTTNKTATNEITESGQSQSAAPAFGTVTLKRHGGVGSTSAAAARDDDNNEDSSSTNDDVTESKAFKSGRDLVKSAEAVLTYARGIQNDLVDAGSLGAVPAALTELAAETVSKINALEKTCQSYELWNLADMPSSIAILKSEPRALGLIRARLEQREKVEEETERLRNLQVAEKNSKNNGLPTSTTTSFSKLGFSPIQKIEMGRGVNLLVIMQALHACVKRIEKVSAALGQRLPEKLAESAAVRKGSLQLFARFTDFVASSQGIMKRLLVSGGTNGASPLNNNNNNNNGKITLLGSAIKSPTTLLSNTQSPLSTSIPQSFSNGNLASVNNGGGGATNLSTNSTTTATNYTNISADPFPNGSSLSSTSTALHLNLNLQRGKSSGGEGGGGGGGGPALLSDLVEYTSLPRDLRLFIEKSSFSLSSVLKTSTDNGAPANVGDVTANTNAMPNTLSSVNVQHLGAALETCREWIAASRQMEQLLENVQLNHIVEQQHLKNKRLSRASSSRRSYANSSGGNFNNNDENDNGVLGRVAAESSSNNKPRRDSCTSTAATQTNSTNPSPASSHSRSPKSSNIDAQQGKSIIRKATLSNPSAAQLTNLNNNDSGPLEQAAAGTRRKSRDITSVSFSRQSSNSSMFASASAHIQHISNKMTQTDLTLKHVNAAMTALIAALPISLSSSPSNINNGGKQQQQQQEEHRDRKKSRSNSKDRRSGNHQGQQESKEDHQKPINATSNNNEKEKDNNERGTASKSGDAFGEIPFVGTTSFSNTNNNKDVNTKERQQSLSHSSSHQNPSVATKHQKRLAYAAVRLSSSDDDDGDDEGDEAGRKKQQFSGKFLDRQRLDNGDTTRRPSSAGAASSSPHPLPFHAAGAYEEGAVHIIPSTFNHAVAPIDILDVNNLSALGLEHSLQTPQSPTATMWGGAIGGASASATSLGFVSRRASQRRSVVLIDEVKRDDGLPHNNNNDSPTADARGAHVHVKSGAENNAPPPSATSLYHTPITAISTPSSVASPNSGSLFGSGSASNHYTALMQGQEGGGHRSPPLHRKSSDPLRSGNAETPTGNSAATYYGMQMIKAAETDTTTNHNQGHFFDGKKNNNNHKSVDDSLVAHADVESVQSSTPSCPSAPLSSVSLKPNEHKSQAPQNEATKAQATNALISLVGETSVPSNEEKEPLMMHYGTQNVPSSDNKNNTASGDVRPPNEEGASHVIIRTLSGTALSTPASSIVGKSYRQLKNQQHFYHSGGSSVSSSNNNNNNGGGPNPQSTTEKNNNLLRKKSNEALNKSVSSSAASGSKSSSSNANTTTKIVVRADASYLAATASSRTKRNELNFSEMARAFNNVRRRDVLDDEGHVLKNMVSGEDYDAVVKALMEHASTLLSTNQEREALVTHLNEASKQLQLAESKSFEAIGSLKAATSDSETLKLHIASLEELIKKQKVELVKAKAKSATPAAPKAGSGTAAGRGNGVGGEANDAGDGENPNTTPANTNNSKAYSSSSVAREREVPRTSKSRIVATISGTSNMLKNAGQSNQPPSAKSVLASARNEQQQEKMKEGVVEGLPQKTEEQSAQYESMGEFSVLLSPPPTARNRLASVVNRSHHSYSNDNNKSLAAVSDKENEGNTKSLPNFLAKARPSAAGGGGGLLGSVVGSGSTSIGGGGGSPNSGFGHMSNAQKPQHPNSFSGVEHGQSELGASGQGEREEENEKVVIDDVMILHSRVHELATISLGKENDFLKRSADMMEEYEKTQQVVNELRDEIEELYRRLEELTSPSNSSVGSGRTSEQQQQKVREIEKGIAETNAALVLAIEETQDHSKRRKRPNGASDDDDGDGNNSDMGPRFDHSVMDVLVMSAELIMEMLDHPATRAVFEKFNNNNEVNGQQDGTRKQSKDSSNDSSSAATTQTRAQQPHAHSPDSDQTKPPNNATTDGADRSSSKLTSGGAERRVPSAQPMNNAVLGGLPNTAGNETADNAIGGSTGPKNDEDISDGRKIIVNLSPRKLKEGSNEGHRLVGHSHPISGEISPQPSTVSGKYGPHRHVMIIRSSRKPHNSTIITDNHTDYSDQEDRSLSYSPAYQVEGEGNKTYQSPEDRFEERQAQQKVLKRAAEARLRDLDPTNRGDHHGNEKARANQNDSPNQGLRDGNASLAQKGMNTGATQSSSMPLPSADEELEQFKLLRERRRQAWADEKLRKEEREKQYAANASVKNFNQRILDKKERVEEERMAILLRAREKHTLRPSQKVSTAAITTEVTTNNKPSPDISKIKAGYAALMVAPIPTLGGTRGGGERKASRQMSLIPDLEGSQTVATERKDEREEGTQQTQDGEGNTPTDRPLFGIPPPTPEEELTRLRAFQLLSRNNKPLSGQKKQKEENPKPPLSSTKPSNNVEDAGASSPTHPKGATAIVSSLPTITATNAGGKQTMGSKPNPRGTIASPRGSLLLPPLSTGNKSDAGGVVRTTQPQAPLGQAKSVLMPGKVFVIQSNPVEPNPTAALPALSTRSQRAKAAKMKTSTEVVGVEYAPPVTEHNDDDTNYKSDEVKHSSTFPNPRLSSKPVVNFAAMAAVQPVDGPQNKANTTAQNPTATAAPPFFVYNMRTSHEAVAHNRASPARGRLAHQIFASDPDYYVALNDHSRQRSTQQPSVSRGGSPAELSSRGGRTPQRRHTSLGSQRRVSVSMSRKESRHATPNDRQDSRGNSPVMVTTGNAHISAHIPLEPTRSTFAPKPSLVKGCSVFEHGQMPPTVSNRPDPLLLQSFLKGSPAPVNQQTLVLRK